MSKIVREVTTSVTKPNMSQYQSWKRRHTHLPVLLPKADPAKRLNPPITSTSKAAAKLWSTLRLLVLAKSIEKRETVNNFFCWLNQTYHRIVVKSIALLLTRPPSWDVNVRALAHRFVTASAATSVHLHQDVVIFFEWPQKRGGDSLTAVKKLGPTSKKGKGKRNGGRSIHM